MLRLTSSTCGLRQSKKIEHSEHLAVPMTGKSWAEVRFEMMACQFDREERVDESRWQVKLLVACAEGL